MFFLLHTCKRQKHPGPVGDLAVQMLLALSNQASPETIKCNQYQASEEKWFLWQLLCFTNIILSLTNLDLFRGEIFGAPEDVALSNPLTAKLVNLDHTSKCYKTHKSVGWQQAQGHLKRFLEGLEIFFFQTCVHNIQKDQRGCSPTL